MLRQIFFAKTNLNIQNSVVMLPFLFFKRKYFYGKISSKKLSYQFKLKFVTTFPLVWKWGARGSSRIPKTLACPPPYPPLFCFQSVDFVIFMQFLAILFKLPPSHRSIPDGKPSVHRRNLICRIQWWCSRFRLPMLQWSKFGPKNQNCQFQLKFDTYTNLNMQNSAVLFTFSVFDSKYLFDQIWSKKKRNYQFQTGFWYHKIQICRIQQLLTFVQFWPGALFWRKLVQTIGIVSLGWNLVSRIIQICRIQLLHLRLLFLLEILFYVLIWPKK